MKKLLEQKDKRKKYRTGKLTVSAAQAKIILKRGKINLRYTTVKAELWKPSPKRCTKCLQPDHMTTDCKNRIKCVVCGDDHAAKECGKQERKDLHKCIVCLRHKFKANHKASLRECPVLMEEAMVELKKVYNIVYDE